MVHISPVQITVWFLLCDRTQADTESGPEVSPWTYGPAPSGIIRFRSSERDGVRPLLAGSQTLWSPEGVHGAFSMSLYLVVAVSVPAHPGRLRFQRDS